jgi:hypothetical protein
MSEPAVMKELGVGAANETRVFDTGDGGRLKIAKPGLVADSVKQRIKNR